MPLRKFRSAEDQGLDPAISGSGPKNISNPFFNEGSDTVEAPFSKRVIAGDGDAASVDTAQELLASGQFENDAHKKRLERIVRTGQQSTRVRAFEDAMKTDEGRRRINAMTDFMTKKLIDAGADPNNPMTVQEFNQGNQQIWQFARGQQLVSPVQLRTANEDADNPQVARVRAANVVAASLGYEGDEAIEMSERALGYIGMNPKTGQPDRDDMFRAFEMFKSERVANQASAISAGRGLAILNKRKQQFGEDHPDMFDNGAFKKRPEVGTGIGAFFDGTFDSTQKAAGKAFDDDPRLAIWQSLNREQTNLEDTILSHAGIGNDAPGAGGDVPKDVPKTDPPPAVAGAGSAVEEAVSTTTPEADMIGLSPQAPFQLQAGNNAKVWARAQAIANKTNKPIYLRLLNGNVKKVSPSAKR